MLLGREKEKGKKEKNIYQHLQDERDEEEERKEREQLLIDVTLEICREKSL